MITLFDKLTVDFNAPSTHSPISQPQQTLSSTSPKTTTTITTPSPPKAPNTTADKENELPPQKSSVSTTARDALKLLLKDYPSRTMADTSSPANGMRFSDRFKHIQQYSQAHTEKMAMELQANDNYSWDGRLRPKPPSFSSPSNRHSGKNPRRLKLQTTIAVTQTLAHPPRAPNSSKPEETTRPATDRTEATTRKHDSLPKIQTARVPKSKPSELEYGRNSDLHLDKPLPPVAIRGILRGKSVTSLLGVDSTAPPTVYVTFHSSADIV